MNETLAFDRFWFYDSSNDEHNLKEMAVITPDQNNYWISLSDIYIEYPAQYVVPKVAFLALTSADEIVRSSIFTGAFPDKREHNRSIFTLSYGADPNRPVCKSYNKVRFSCDDKFKMIFGDDTMTIVDAPRIVCLLHVSDDPNIIRTALH